MTTTIAEPTQLVRPNKVDQVAALMLLMFKANPGVRMTRFDVEDSLIFAKFPVSDSTKQRALNVLCIEGHIKYESHWPSPQATLYWMPKSGKGQ